MFYLKSEPPTGKRVVHGSKFSCSKNGIECNYNLTRQSPGRLLKQGNVTIFLFYLIQKYLYLRNCIQFRFSYMRIYFHGQRTGL